MTIDWQSPASWMLTTCTFGQSLHEITLPFSNQEGIHTAMPTSLVPLSDHQKEWSCFPHFPHSKKKEQKNLTLLLCMNQQI